MATRQPVRSGIREYGWVMGTRVAGSGPDTLIPQTGIRWHAGARGSVTSSEVTGTASRRTREVRRLLLTDAETGPDPTNPVERAFSRPPTRSPPTAGLSNADIANAAVRLGAPASARHRRRNWWGCAAGPGTPAATPSRAAPERPIELGTPLTTAPPALNVPAIAADAPPTASFVDPGEGDDVAVGQTITPAVLAGDDLA